MDGTRPIPTNGVAGETGDYLFSPMTPDEVLAVLRGREVAPAGQLHALAARARNAGEPTLGLMYGIDPADLAQAGWGVLFPSPLDLAVKQALEPLLEHRWQQAGRRFRELCFCGATAIELLAHHCAGPGPVDPRILPYYLLIVGGPAEVPFDFQYQLDVSHAVGRLCFDGPDRLDRYAHYARSVVQAETAPPRRDREVVLFGPRTEGDPATEITCDKLVGPLAQELAERLRQQPPGWKVRPPITGAEAGKGRLLALLAGCDKPSLLLAACHGVGFRGEDPRQRGQQGALLCQEWQGAGHGISPDCYVSALDLSDRAEPHGLVTFLVSCYGAGTPALNDFAHRGGDEPLRIAPEPFVAGLPQRLLGHPNGGALAVVGHVDRAWSYSFDWPLAGADVQAFASTFLSLLEGNPVGHAMDFLNLRYATLAVAVTEQRRRPMRPDLLHSAAFETALLDARNYVLLGDPAVRLPAAQSVAATS